MDDFNELDLILGTQLDFRGPTQFDDEELSDPAGDFAKAQADEMSKKQAGVVALSVIVPTFEHVLGLRSEQDIVLKADEPVEHIEDNSLHKNAELSTVGSILTPPLGKTIDILADEDQEFAREHELYKAMYS